MSGITSCSEFSCLYLISLSSLCLKSDLSRSTGNVNVCQRWSVSRSSVRAANRSGVGSVRSSTWDFLLSSLAVLFGFGHISRKEWKRSANFLQRMNLDTLTNTRAAFSVKIVQTREAFFTAGTVPQFTFARLCQHAFTNDTRTHGLVTGLSAEEQPEKNA